MSRGCGGVELDPWGFPRVSGDEPAGDYLASGLLEFSPRERG